MTAVNGCKCDECGKISEDIDQWMKLIPRADKDGKGFDICSNTCLIRKARKRKQEMGY